MKGGTTGATMRSNALWSCQAMEVRARENNVPKIDEHIDVPYATGADRYRVRVADSPRADRHDTSSDDATLGRVGIANPHPQGCWKCVRRLDRRAAKMYTSPLAVVVVHD